ncbi:MAG: hypothetical protein KAS07_03685 [Candidatus Pacebacteria bacterium]|nr:hypothetical protein [Candidatus Paceibacterota bacterium]
MENEKGKKKYWIIGVLTLVLLISISAGYFGVEWFLEEKRFKTEFPDDSPKTVIKNLEQGTEQEFNDGKDVFVEGIEDSTEMRKIANVDEGYSFLFPASWGIHHPMGKGQPFLMYAPEDSVCSQMGVGGILKNPDNKSYEDLIKENISMVDPGNTETELYDKILGAYTETTIYKELHEQISISIAIPFRLDYLIVSITADGSVMPQECVALLEKVSSSLEVK